MGFWDWIKELFASADEDGGQPGKQPSATATTVGQPGGEGAVATLEAPEGQSQQPASETPPAKWWEPEGERLTEPKTLERPDLSTEGLMLENMLIAQFDGHDLNLPPLPGVVERVLHRLGATNSSLAEVAKDIGDDQVLAASILRIANSPLYRALDKITALDAAVVRLGARAVRTLMLHESLRAATFGISSAGGEFAQYIWRRALASACIMRGMARYVKLDREVAFSYGLLYNIGNVMVLRVIFGSRALSFDVMDYETFDYLCAECHQELGELVADAWKLPDNLKSLIADHHTYPAPDDPLRVERLSLQLTGMICSLLGYEPYEPYDLLQSTAAKELGLDTREDFKRYLADLPEDVEETLAEL